MLYSSGLMQKQSNSSLTGTIQSSVLFSDINNFVDENDSYMQERLEQFGLENNGNVADGSEIEDEEDETDSDHAFFFSEMLSEEQL